MSQSAATTHPGVAIRRATAREHAAIGELCVAAYAGMSAPDQAGYAAHLRNAAARDLEAELWVAVTADEAHSEDLLGTVTVCPDGSPWREIARGDEYEFRMLAVAPTAQGRGVGEALVRHVLDRAREAGSSRVVLSTLAEMSAAHRLYERLGFRRAPERDWSPREGIDLVAYLLDLTP